MLDLAIRGGTVVTATESRRADIGIEDGLVAAIGTVPAARQDLDANGLLVLPGLVDGHTHLGYDREHDGIGTADDFASGSIAAACGGVTTVIDYARQRAGLTLADTIADWHARAESKSVVDYGFHLIVSDFSDEGLAQIPAAVADGFPSVKAFLPLIGDAELLRLMEAAAGAGALVLAHAENNHVLEQRQRRLFAVGRRSARWYADSRPELGEAEATARAIDYAQLTGATVCIVHLSCDAALQRVRDARARGADVWAETRPCYLLLDATRYEADDLEALRYTGCPPLRPAWNLDRLWQGLADGALDLVGSDHCAWTIEEKSAGLDDFSRIPKGIPALETQLATLWTAGVETGRISANRLVDVLSTTPARLHGLFPRKGTIVVGSDADIVLFDPTRQETVTQARLHSLAGYEPCEGMRCRGWPVATISRGEVIARDGECLATPGRGLLLPRKPPARDVRRSADAHTAARQGG